MTRPALPHLLKWATETPTPSLHVAAELDQLGALLREIEKEVGCQLTGVALDGALTALLAVIDFARLTQLSPDSCQGLVGAILFKRYLGEVLP